MHPEEEVVEEQAPWTDDFKPAAITAQELEYVCPSQPQRWLSPGIGSQPIKLEVHVPLNHLCPLGQWQLSPPVVEEELEVEEDVVDVLETNAHLYPCGHLQLLSPEDELLEEELLEEEPSIGQQ